MIITKTIELLKKKYGNRFSELTIQKVNIGVYLTAVELSDGSVGVASTHIDEHSECLKHKRDFEVFSPTKIIGQKVQDLLDSINPTKASNTLKSAVLNALSSKYLTEYKIVENTDPIDLVDLSDNKTITIVGAFHSYIKKIAQTGCKLNVLELNQAAMRPEDMKYFVPANQAASVIPESNIVIITGLTIVNDTLNDLLNLCTENQTVIVTGPTSSIIPDALFENKVSILGAVAIDDKESMFSVVSQAGSGFHLFKYGCRKITIIR